MKKNKFLRAAAVFLALTFASMPVSLSSAKYYSDDIEAHADEIRVFHLLPKIEHSNTALSAQAMTSYPNVPKGYWAFYLRGESGETRNRSGLGAGTSKNGGQPGVLRGIFYLPSNSNFVVGKTRGGTRNDGTLNYGGHGGGAEFILWGVSVPGTITNAPVPSGDVTNIVAIAGGGGGNCQDNGHGGHAGASSATANSTTMQGHQNGPGYWPGCAGYNTASPAFGPNRNGASGGGGGAPDSPDYSSTDSGWGGEYNTSNYGTGGSWFQTGSGGNAQNSSYVCGGGGGGLWGGGGGGREGSGGGGNSFSNATSAVPTAKYANPTSYYQHAVNYFIDSIPSGDLKAVLVWLGPVMET
jgi:hypothetical protein